MISILRTWEIYVNHVTAKVTLALLPVYWRPDIFFSSNIEMLLLNIKEYFLAALSK